MSTGSTGVSVAICCFNSAARLPQTLAHLARQSVPDDVPWEVLVIDNASTDTTASFAVAEWERLGSTAPLRVVSQPLAGLSFAREMAMAESTYEYVLFCDDDNWLDEGYVAVAFEVMQANPAMAVIGGQGEAVCEVTPPAWFEKYALWYAVGPQGEETGDVTDTKGYVYGAGFVIRKRAWQQLIRSGFRLRLTGRSGTKLSSSEDREVCYAFQAMNYRIGYDDRMRFEHFLPAGRLDWSYYLRLVEIANRTTPYMSAYAAALSGSVAGEGRSPRHWLSMCVGLVLQMVTKPLFVVSVLRAREGSGAAVRWRRIRGALHGWWTVRDDHRVLMDDIARLRSESPPMTVRAEPEAR